MKKTIIFDADGTLLDSLWVWETLVINYLKSININPDDNIKEILWPMSYKEGIFYIIKKYNLKQSYNQIDSILQFNLFDSYQNKVRLFEKVEELLSSLSREKYSLLVASASPKKLLLSSLSNLKIINYFDKIISEEDYNISKTDSLFFQKLSHNCNFEFSNSILIDDSYFPLKSAKNLKMKTIGIVNNKNDEMFSTVCDHMINSIGELNEESINDCWK